LLHRPFAAPHSTLPQYGRTVFLRRDLRQRADYFADSSQLFERSAPQARAVSFATGHEIEQTQGSRCAAPTALSMHRGLPGHDFAARPSILQ